MEKNTPKDSNEFEFSGGEALLSIYVDLSKRILDHLLNIQKEIESRKASKQSVSLDWEIVSIKHDSGGFLDVSHIKNTDKYYSNRLEEWGDKIYAVKRLSDGAIFTIGDIVEWNLIERKGEPKFKIDSFNINRIIKPDRMFINNRNIDICYLTPAPLKKSKPLFRTEDGFDFYEGTNIFLYTVGKKTFEFNTFSYSILTSKNIDSYKKDYAYFKEKSAADEYILLNKPVLSLSDMEQYRYGYDKEYFAGSYDRLKQLAKTKL